MCAIKNNRFTHHWVLNNAQNESRQLTRLTPQVVMYGSLNTLLHSGQYSLGDAPSANNTISYKNHINTYI